MTVRMKLLSVALPGLRAFRWSSDAPYVAMKESYAIGLVSSGRTLFLQGGREYRSEPGAIQLKQPGDVHRDVACDGATSLQVVAFPASAVESVVGVLRVPPLLGPTDPRAAPFRRLHAAIADGAERLSLEVLVAEAITSLQGLPATRSALTRPVRHAVELLRARFDEPILLDDLAVHASCDKYHLCRAFRAEVGMPPHGYLTELRVLRAKELLRAGTRPRDVAARVGFYDQSQLHRHFRRIVGTTPGRYARGQ